MPGDPRHGRAAGLTAHLGSVVVGAPGNLTGGESSPAWSSGPAGASGGLRARIHTRCAVVSSPTLDRAFARWRFTVECDRPRGSAAAFSDPAQDTPYCGTATV